ncbi:MAG: outer membrane protein [Candidatus Electrothrix sp. YB6]
MMKKSLMMLAGAAVLSCSSIAYSAPGYDPGPGPGYAPGYMYISLNGGLAALGDLDLADKDGYGYGTLESSSGLALAGAIGYDAGIVRMEAEVSYQENDADQAVSNTGEVIVYGSGNALSTSATALLFNGYFNFLSNSPVTPYLTAGIGGINVEAEQNNISSDDNALAYQVGAGFACAVNEMVSLDLKYRYLGSDELQFDRFDDSGFDKYESHNVYGGFRFIF